MRGGKCKSEHKFNQKIYRSATDKKQDVNIEVVKICSTTTVLFLEEEAAAASVFMRSTIKHKTHRLIVARYVQNVLLFLIFFC